MYLSKWFIFYLKWASIPNIWILIKSPFKSILPIHGVRGGHRSQVARWILTSNQNLGSPHGRGVKDANLRCSKSLIVGSSLSLGHTWDKPSLICLWVDRCFFSGISRFHLTFWLAQLKMSEIVLMGHKTQIKKKSQSLTIESAWVKTPHGQHVRITFCMQLIKWFFFRDLQF